MKEEKENGDNYKVNESRHRRNVTVGAGFGLGAAAVFIMVVLVMAGGPVAALSTQQQQLQQDESDEIPGEPVDIYTSPDPRPEPKWWWRVNPTNTMILGPMQEECFSRVNDAYWLINAHETSAFFPFLVQNYLDYNLCVEEGGSYPYYDGYAVVEASMFVMPRSTYNLPSTTLAGMIVHEACHVYQYEHGWETWGPEAEYQCTWWQVLALKGIGGNPAEIERLENVMRAILEEDYSWWD